MGTKGEKHKKLLGLKDKEQLEILELRGKAWKTLRL